MKKKFFDILSLTTAEFNKLLIDQHLSEATLCLKLLIFDKIP